jgi:Uma2 family endonuclease
MSQAIESPPAVWTAVDLVARYGAIPLDRVRTNPPPGSATERDVIEIHDRENRLCELVDGSLLEKTMSSFESYLAVYIAHLLTAFVEEKRLGIILGADGMLRLARGLVRIPDVSFISWDRLPGRVFPREDIWSIAPDLAVEVISRGNTREEMEQKLLDYFTAGVRLVWYVYPAKRAVHVHTSPEKHIVLSGQDTLDGGDVLPGFRLPLETLFTRPGEGGLAP